MPGEHEDQPPITIRTMGAGDIEAGMRLKRLAGWNQVEADWRLFLAASPAGCFAAEADGRVVGTVTSINYGGIVSWIAMVLVDPEYRRRGIGTRLLRTALNYLADRCETIKLDATPAGKMLYDTLGFRDEYGLRRMVHAGPDRAPAPPGGVRPIAPGDLPALLALDGTAFGVSRRVVLHDLLQRMPSLGWVRVAGGRPVAFCMGRDGENFCQIGPIVAEGTEDAAAVAAAALGTLPGRPILMDVLNGQDEFLRWLETRGFTGQRPFIRMCRGPNRRSGRPALQFAGAGPELG